MLAIISYFPYEYVKCEKLRMASSYAKIVRQFQFILGLACTGSYQQQVSDWLYTITTVQDLFLESMYNIAPHLVV